MMIGCMVQQCNPVAWATIQRFQGRSKFAAYLTSSVSLILNLGDTAYLQTGYGLDLVVLVSGNNNIVSLEIVGMDVLEEVG